MLFEFSIVNSYGYTDEINHNKFANRCDAVADESVQHRCEPIASAPDFRQYKRQIA